MSGKELAGLALTDNLTLRSIGMAAINALLPRQPDSFGSDYHLRAG